MVVVTVTNCPPGLRGDLSKWLCEINVGVYVGNISTRVRQNLWTRICENLSSGQATMVYPAMNEQDLILSRGILLGRQSIMMASD